MDPGRTREPHASAVVVRRQALLLKDARSGRGACRGALRSPRPAPGRTAPPPEAVGTAVFAVPTRRHPPALRPPTGDRSGAPARATTRRLRPAAPTQTVHRTRRFCARYCPNPRLLPCSAAGRGRRPRLAPAATVRVLRHGRAVPTARSRRVRFPHADRATARLRYGAVPDSTRLLGARARHRTSRRRRCGHADPHRRWSATRGLCRVGSLQGASLRDRVLSRRPTERRPHPAPAPRPRGGSATATGGAPAQCSPRSRGSRFFGASSTAADWRQPG